MQEQGAGASNLVTGFGYDQFYARTDGSGTQVPLSDSLQSTVGMTDAGGGLGAQYTYEPYGSTTVAGSGGGSQQCTGRENDGTGLMYYRARYYAPGMGRFVSEDPLGFGGGDVNLYGYVGGGPLNANDPTGRLFGLGFDFGLGLGGLALSFVFFLQWSQLVHHPISNAEFLLTLTGGFLGGGMTGGIWAAVILGGALGGLSNYLQQRVDQPNQPVNCWNVFWSVLLGAGGGFLGSSFGLRPGMNREFLQLLRWIFGGLLPIMIRMHLPA